MTTNKMLMKIVKYKYKANGFPYVFLDYSQTDKNWQITWRNPVDFSNNKQTEGKTPKQACKKALEFIDKNPIIFNG